MFDDHVVPWLRELRGADTVLAIRTDLLGDAKRGGQKSRLLLLPVPVADLPDRKSTRLNSSHT